MEAKQCTTTQQMNCSRNQRDNNKKYLKTHKSNDTKSMGQRKNCVLSFKREIYGNTSLPQAKRKI